MASQSEIAGRLRMSLVRLTQLMAKGVLPVSDDPEYMLTAYIDYLRGMAAGHLSSDGISLPRERARLAAEQADAVSMKNALARGDMVSFAAVAKEVVNVLLGLRGNLLAWPNKMALAVAPETDLVIGGQAGLRIVF